MRTPFFTALVGHPAGDRRGEPVLGILGHRELLTITSLAVVCPVSSLVAYCATQILCRQAVRTGLLGALTCNRTRVRPQDALLRRSAMLSAGLLIGPAALDRLAGASAAELSADVAHFVDSYRTNVPANLTPETNAAVRVLAGMQELWRTGTAWDNGVVLQPGRAHGQRPPRRADHPRRGPPEQAKRAFIVDRQHQSYAAIGGLGPLADAVPDGSQGRHRHHLRAGRHPSVHCGRQAAAGRARRLRARRRLAGLRARPGGAAGQHAARPVRVGQPVEVRLPVPPAVADDAGQHGRPDRRHRRVRVPGLPLRGRRRPAVAAPAQPQPGRRRRLPERAHQRAAPGVPGTRLRGAANGSRNW